MGCNKKLGNDFEADLCEILSKHDFWAHNLAQNQAGQPADVIAVKRGHAYLIDCKVCSSHGFPLSRVEENQKLAMSLWKSCGNGEGWFALKLVDEIIMVPHVFIESVAKQKSRMNLADIHKFGIPLERWIEMDGEWT